MKGLFPDWEISSESIADSPGWGILKRAESLHVNVIAIGAHSQPAIFDRYFFGSVASEIIINAPCSVRICRPREPQNQNLRILVAIDGSDDSALAFHQITTPEWPPEAEFRVVTALDSKIHDALLGPRFSESVHADFARSADSIPNLSLELAAELREKGKPADALVLAGDPKSQILQVAEEWNVDCIFVGARGLHHGCERRLGSVASAISRWARCSVEICRPILNAR